MKKILIILLTFLFCFFINNIYAQEYITYSDWSEEYPSWLDSIFIESEDRYLWYKEVINEDTNEVERENIEEYYKELEGYIKIEESIKTFYRYITNEKVLFDGRGSIVYDMEYCYKSYCFLKKIPEKPKEDIIENPKTYDNIFVFIILFFFSFVSIVLILGSKKNKSSFVESI